VGRGGYNYPDQASFYRSGLYCLFMSAENIDCANIDGRIGVSDAMVTCRSTQGLPIWSEENF